MASNKLTTKKGMAGRNLRHTKMISTEIAEALTCELENQERETNEAYNRLKISQTETHNRQNHYNDLAEKCEALRTYLLTEHIDIDPITCFHQIED